MYTVGIKDFKFWTFIGIFDEEKIIPNQLTFNIQLTCNNQGLGNYIDYTILIGIIRNISKQSFDTLEEILELLKTKVIDQFDITSFYIRIDKQTPPTGDHFESSFVIWEE